MLETICTRGAFFDTTVYDYDTIGALLRVHHGVSISYVQCRAHVPI